MTEGEVIYGMLASISIAVIAAAVLVVSFYIVRTLQSVRSSVHHLAESTAHMKQVTATLQRQVDGISNETEALIIDTHSLLRDVQGKMKQVDPLFTSVAEVGESVGQMTKSMKQVSAAVSHSADEAARAVHSHQDRINEVMEWVTTGLNLWKSVQAHKNAEKTRKGDEQDG